MVAQAKGLPPGKVMTDADVLGSTGTSCNQNIRGGDHGPIRRLHIGILWYNTLACLGQGETHDIRTHTVPGGTYAEYKCTGAMQSYCTRGGHSDGRCCNKVSFPSNSKVP